MSFSKNRNEHMELDVMQIKFHLNASLDMDNIHASEELIQKTLKAVKEHTTVSSQTVRGSEGKGIYSLGRFAFRIAGAAAAVILVIAGLGVMTNHQFIGSKSESPNLLMKSADTAQDNGAEENFNIPSGSRRMGEAVEKEATGADAVTSNYTASSCEQAVSDTDADTREKQKKDTANAVISFADICILTPKQCANIEITDDMEASSVTIEDQTKIKDFFALMKDYTFSEESDTSRTKYFSIKLSSLETLDTVCDIGIGDTITVRHKTGDTVNESFYAIDDYEAFKKGLEEVYRKYKK